MMPRVVIADDHPLFVLGLKYALSAQSLEVIGEARNGQEAVDVCLRHKPDVVLMDIRMPVLDGILACQAITKQDPEIVVIMLSTFEEPGVMRAAERAGAKAYFSKETEPRDLSERIRQILDNPRRNWMPRVKVPQLTPREDQVLKFLSQGLTNKDIARELNLSPDTVKDHIERLYGKLEAKDRITALNKSRELGLLESFEKV